MHDLKRRRRTDEGMLSLVQVLSACAAYALALALCVLMFGLSPGAESPAVPPPQHPHVVDPTGAPLEAGVASNPRCTSARAGARPCGHEHSGLDHQPGHDVHQRLSPRQLSLAKWGSQNHVAVRPGRSPRGSPRPR